MSVDKDKDKDKDEVVIGISKIKSCMMTFIAIGLFSFAVVALINILKIPAGFDKAFLLAGIFLFMIFGGLSIISGIRRLLSNNYGLIINANGIMINIGPNRGQLIEWVEIKSIKLHNQFKGPMYLLIFVKDTTKVLTEAKIFNRFMLKLNSASHKTPVSITSTWLDADIMEIMEIIKERMSKYNAHQ